MPTVLKFKNIFLELIHISRTSHSAWHLEGTHVTWGCQKSLQTSAWVPCGGSLHTAALSRGRTLGVEFICPLSGQARRLLTLAEASLRQKG